MVPDVELIRAEATIVPSPSAVKFAEPLVAVTAWLTVNWPALVVNRISPLPPAKMPFIEPTEPMVSAFDSVT